MVGEHVVREGIAPHQCGMACGVGPADRNPQPGSRAQWQQGFVAQQHNRLLGKAPGDVPVDGGVEVDGGRGSLELLVKETQLLFL